MLHTHHDGQACCAACSYQLMLARVLTLVLDACRLYPSVEVWRLFVQMQGAETSSLGRWLECCWSLQQQQQQQYQWQHQWQLLPCIAADSLCSSVLVASMRQACCGFYVPGCIVMRVLVGWSWWGCNVTKHASYISPCHTQQLCHQQGHACTSHMPACMHPPSSHQQHATITHLACSVMRTLTPLRACRAACARS